MSKVSVVLVALVGLAVVAAPAEALAQRKAPAAGLAARVQALEARVAALEAALKALQPSPRLAALGRHVSVRQGAMNGLPGPHVIITGANLHLRSGSGATDDTDDEEVGNVTTPRGLGNLVVGYNEARPSEVRAGPLAPGARGGSHNVVIGAWHRYPSVGGLVAGFGSTTSGPFASVSGGVGNTASGDSASVSGGRNRTAAGEFDWRAGGLAQDQ
jgi:hypothetical protein